MCELETILCASKHCKKVFKTRRSTCATKRKQLEWIDYQEHPEDWVEEKPPTPPTQGAIGFCEHMMNVYGKLRKGEGEEFCDDHLKIMWAEESRVEEKQNETPEKESQEVLVKLVSSLRRRKLALKGEHVNS